MILMYCYTLYPVVAPTLTETPRKQTITEGSKVRFLCTASGNPVPQIKWTKDEVVVGEGETLTFDALRNRSGEYWCMADNGLNDTANASAYLDVHCKYDAVGFVPRHRHKGWEILTCVRTGLTLSVSFSLI